MKPIHMIHITYRWESLDEILSNKQAEQLSLLGEAGFSAAEELGPALDASEEVGLICFCCMHTMRRS
jgi:hypothetical protein